MKTVTYMLKNFQVPDWAKFIAADCDGQVFCYEASPIKKEFNYWSVSGYQAQYVGKLMQQLPDIKEIF